MPVTVTGWSDVHTPDGSMNDVAAAPWGTAIACGTGGLYTRSTAAGAWTDFDLSLATTTLTGVAYGATGQWVLLGANGDGDPVILFSDDDGLTFAACTTDLTAIGANNTVSHCVAYNSATATFVALVHDGSTDCTALQSADGGDNWSSFTGPDITSDGMKSLRWDSVSGRFIAVLTGTTSVSDDDGETWSSPASAPGTSTAFPFPVDVVRAGSRLYLAGGEESPSNITARTWKSEDNGDTFSLLSPTGVGSPPRLILAAVSFDDEIVALVTNLSTNATVATSANGTAFVSTSAPAVIIGIIGSVAKMAATGTRLILVVTDDGSAHHIFEGTLVPGYADIVDVFSRGRVMYRLVIEGARAEWCNHIALATASATEGRVRYPHLMMEDAVLSEQAELREGSTKIKPLTLKITSDEASDLEFGKVATKLAYLSTGVDTVDGATFEVTNDTLITVGDYLHLGTECVEVTDVDTGTLTVRRQARGTRPQLHTLSVTGEGATASSTPGWAVALYDKPPTLQGRRAVLTAYSEDGDAEAIVWMGRLSTHPYLDEDGVSWRLDIDHLSTLMDQTIGEIISGQAGLRGARYHAANQFSFSIEYTRAGTTIERQFAFEGYFEDDAAFLAELQSQLDSVGTTGITWSVYRNGASQIVLEFTTDTSFADDDSDEIVDIRVGSAIDGVTREVSSDENGILGGSLFSALSDTTTRYVVLNGSRKNGGWAREQYRLSALAGQIVGIPRGCVGDPKIGAFSGDLYETEDNTDSAFVLPLERDIGAVGGQTVVTISNAIWPASPGQRFSIDLRVTTVADGGRTLTLDSAQFQSTALFNTLAGQSEFLWAPCFYYDEQTRVSARVSYGEGSWRDLLQTVVDVSPQANTGATPFVTGDDLETDEFFADEINRRLVSSFVTQRYYQPAVETALIDVLRPELVLTMCLLRMSANGLIGVAPLMRPSPLAQTSIDIDEHIIVSPDGDTGDWPLLQASPDGVVCSVKIEDGESQYLIRDELALSHYKNRGAGIVELKLESQRPDDGFGPAATAPDEVSRVGKSILSFFSASYSVVTVSVTYAAIGVLVGDYVRLTSSYVLNPQTGTRGIDAVCLVLGREWPLDPMAGDHGTLTLMAFTADVGGYAPSARVTNVSGDYASLASTTLTVAQNEFSTADEADLDHFAVGDPVRVIAWDTTSSLGFRGTITSIPNATTCVITPVEYLGNPGIRTLHLEFDHASVDVTEHQAPYVYIANAAGQVEGEEGFDFE